jgi:hypothetical protein
MIFLSNIFPEEIIDQILLYCDTQDILTLGEDKVSPNVWIKKDKTLLSACKNGNLIAATRFITDRISYHNNSNLLYWSLKNNHFEIVKFLMTYEISEHLSYTDKCSGDFDIVYISLHNIFLCASIMRGRFEINKPLQMPAMLSNIDMTRLYIYSKEDSRHPRNHNYRCNVQFYIRDERTRSIVMYIISIRQHSLRSLCEQIE